MEGGETICKEEKIPFGKQNLYLGICIILKQNATLCQILGPV